MWTPLRANITKVVNELKIQDKLFHPVPINQWKSIQQRIFNTFCHLRVGERSSSLWTYFKPDSYTIYYHYNYPFKELLNFIGSDEKVWLLLNETVKEHEKFWYYEGYIEQIVQVISESILVTEVYIVSKKFNWLICINRYDALIATGEIMPGKLRALEAGLK